MYAYGGWNGTTAFTTVDIYNFSTNAWSTGTSSAAGRYASAMVVYGDKFYIWSGQNTAGTYLNTMDIYDFGATTTTQVVSGKIQGYSGGVGSSGAVAYTTFGADYAEYFKANPNDMPVSGELVLLDPAVNQGVIRTAGNVLSETQPLAGIVSTSPGFIGNGPLCNPSDTDCDKNYAKYNALVALSGQVPAKVNDTNGPINIGDPITLSSVAGEGAKATATGYIVGYALEPLTSGSGTIKVLVRPQHYTNNTTSMLQGTGLSIAGDTLLDGKVDITGALNVNGLTTLTDLVVTGNATITGTLTVNNIIANNLTINGHIITAGNTPTVTVGTAAGTSDPQNNIPSPQVSIEGNDTAGTITIVAGANTTAGTVAEVAFSTPFAKTPEVVLSPSNQEASVVGIYRDASTGTFKVILKNPPTTGSTYKVGYFVIGVQ